MSKEFIIRQIDDDKDLDYYSKQGWVVKQVITHEVVHNSIKGLKWDRYHILFERDNEDEDTKKLKALEIIKEHEVIVSALLKAEDVSEYNKGWLIKKNEITQEEFDLLKEVME